MAQGLVRLGSGLPALGVPAATMGALNAVMAMIAAIRNALGVNLLAPNARAGVRAAMGSVPFAALSQLSLPVAANAGTTAQAQASISQVASAQAAASLNLQGVSRADFRALAGASMTMRLAASASGLLMAPGTCGQPCPVATFEPIAGAV